MAKDKKLVEAITSMEEDFAQWYTDVVKKAELCDYTSVKGCMVIKPAGYAIWENIQNELDRRFKETGVQNVYMPMFIPESLLQREKTMWRALHREVAWVTHGGLEPLQERLCVRPTSETLFCDFYQKEIQSHRDLPKVYNQWCSVVRWEKQPVRSSAPASFLWQEAIRLTQLPRKRRAHHSDAERVRGFLRTGSGNPGYEGTEDGQGKICRRRGDLYDRGPDARWKSAAVRYQP